MATEDANAYGYENVGLESINTQEGNAYGYENVGAEAVVIPPLTPTEYWGVVGSGGGSVLVVDSRLDGHAYGYENVTT